MKRSDAARRDLSRQIKRCHARDLGRHRGIESDRRNLSPADYSWRSSARRRSVIAPDKRPGGGSGYTNRRLVEAGGVRRHVTAPAGLVAQGGVASDRKLGDGHGRGSRVGDERRGQVGLQVQVAVHRNHWKRRFSGSVEGGLIKLTANQLASVSC